MHKIDTRTVANHIARQCAMALEADVTVAYQTSAEPGKVAQAENTFAKESGPFTSIIVAVSDWL